MNQEIDSSEERIYFFDNIRYLMVLLVVVLHSAAGYSFYSSWWPVNDLNSYVFDVVLAVLDVFLMPTLFFIAGYFALPSLKRKSTWSFIKNKLRRLGIPCLVGIVLFNPVNTYITNYSRGYNYLNFWDIFLGKVESALQFQTGIIDSGDQFQHNYFWFISLLLLFFIVFALLHKAGEKLFKKPFFAPNSKVTADSRILLTILAFGFFIVAGSLLLQQFLHITSFNSSWIIIANLIQFQLVRIVLYIACFSLGIVAFHGDWFAGKKVPVNLVILVIVSSVLWYILGYVAKNYLWDLSLQIDFIAVFVRTFLFLTILLMLISLGAKRWDSSSRVNRLLATNSYNVYLVHMVFVLLSQLVLYKWFDGFIYIKFLIVCVVSIGLSVLFSQFAIRKSPGATVAGLVGLFILLSATLGPG